MKKQIILVAATALVLTACRTQEYISPSATRVSGDQTSSGSLPSQSETESGDVASQESTSGSSALTTDELIARLDWSRKDRYLDEVLEILDANQFTYRGTWTISLERAELLLEDGTTLIFLKTTDESGNETGAELMMINERFHDSSFQEHYLNQYDVTSAEEYYPETAARLLKKEELWKYNQTDLSIARNEIFARHGRRFDGAFLNAVFSRKTWYQPAYSGDEFNTIQSSVLNDFEKKNLALIIEMEEERGFRTKGGKSYEQPVPIVNGSWIDLDMDGQKERITYRTKTNDPYSDEIYQLGVGDDQVSGPGESLHRVPYIASLDGKTTQLIVSQDGPSDDPMADVYVYRDGHLKKAGVIPGDDIRIYSDSITCMSQRDFFQTYQGTQKFQFLNDTVTFVPEEFYVQNKEAVATAVIPLYSGKQAADISVTLSPGDKVVILGSDYREWVSIQKTATGEKGWLRCGSGDNPYICTLPDGTQEESWNLFDGLRFYG